MKHSLQIVKPWFLYILECKDGTFYTGITNDLIRRTEKHNTGKGARYTKTRRPVKLLYYEICTNRSQALIREYEVKSLSRKQKEKLCSCHTLNSPSPVAAKLASITKRFSSGPRIPSKKSLLLKEGSSGPRSTRK